MEFEVETLWDLTKEISENHAITVPQQPVSSPEDAATAKPTTLTSLQETGHDAKSLSVENRASDKTVLNVITRLEQGWWRTPKTKQITDNQGSEVKRQCGWREKINQQTHS